jgi:hypothetical protein
MTDAQIIAETVCTKVAPAFAAMNTSNNNGNRHPTSYCWSHGTTMNLCHTSNTCNHHADGHKEEATATTTRSNCKIQLQNHFP